jgi:hypothetical protein
MKVLHVCNYFKPSWDAGGVVRVCYDITRRLVESGHDVTVYTTNRYMKKVNVEPNRPVEVDGITVYYFDNLKRFLPVEPFPYYMPVIACVQVRGIAYGDQPAVLRCDMYVVEYGPDNGSLGDQWLYPTDMVVMANEVGLDKNVVSRPDDLSEGVPGCPAEISLVHSHQAEQLSDSRVAGIIAAGMSERVLRVLLSRVERRFPAVIDLIVSNDPDFHMITI